MLPTLLVSFRALILALEIYHLVSHIYVMFGVRLLPRKDLVRVRYYFLIDTCTVVTSTILAAPHLWWLTVPQVAQHLFYFITWEKSTAAKKVITWSSLESKTHLNNGRRFSVFLWDLVLGTGFDIAVHAVFTYQLYCQIPFPSVLVSFCWSSFEKNVTVETIGLQGFLIRGQTTIFSVILCLALVRGVLYNDKFAWSSDGQIHGWIQRRLNPALTY